MPDIEYVDDQVVNRVRNVLSESVGTVVFTKKDGTERKMICTTSTNLIPSESLTTSDNPRKPNPDVQTVWDLQKAFSFIRDSPSCWPLTRRSGAATSPWLKKLESGAIPVIPGAPVFALQMYQFFSCRMCHLCNIWESAPVLFFRLHSFSFGQPDF